METIEQARLDSTQPVSSKRILIVDDEPFVCEAVKMMLSFDGHGVTTAASGKEALTRLGMERFDLVITDFAMPAMKGNDLAKAVKARHPGMPVVMITAYAEVLDPKRDSLESVDCVLSKPFMLEDLRDAIVRATTGK